MLVVLHSYVNVEHFFKNIRFQASPHFPRERLQIERPAGLFGTSFEGLEVLETHFQNLHWSRNAFSELAPEQKPYKLCTEGPLQTRKRDFARFEGTQLSKSFQIQGEGGFCLDSRRGQTFKIHKMGI